jgi:hypothetical protein
VSDAFIKAAERIKSMGKGIAMLVRGKRRKSDTAVNDIAFLLYFVTLNFLPNGNNS